MTDVPVSQEAGEVMQADREAAASVAVLVEMREMILSGRADHHAEPFARHRQQAERAFEDRERKLREALHDAINAPKGVVPASAEAFYDPALCSLREMQTSLPNTVRYLALKETPDAQ